jgi:hypothetical protein
LPLQTGFWPSVLYLNDAPGVGEVSVTCWAPVYEPGAGSNTGAAAGGVITYSAPVTALSIFPLAQAMALNVVDVVTSSAAVYTVPLLQVAGVPSLV